MLESENMKNELPEQSLGGDMTKTALLKQASKEALWLKVLAMLDKTECQQSSFMTADYLGAEASDVIYALEAMEHIGWVQKKSGKYERTHQGAGD